ncbi:ATP-binding protein [Streptomyces avermitilis]|uniref:ATP-binding protein n=1 Tax=Streptomyces avermitilis TaxID=33903 RepID=UPI00368108A1
MPELRHAVREYLDDPCCEVQFCVSELVADVIRHVDEGTPVRVRVSRREDGGPRIEVTDPDPRALPVLLHATATDEGGRGLVLLDAMALRWGCGAGNYGQDGLVRAVAGLDCWGSQDLAEPYGHGEVSGAA